MNNSTQLSALEALLQKEQADYSILTDTDTIKTASSGAQTYGISLNETTPTLILKNENTFIAAIICGNTRISFKTLKQALNSKNISMADPQTILDITNARIGEVSLINPSLPTVIDIRVLQNKNCYGGCGVPQTTLRINTQDLVRITNAQIIDFAEPRP